MLWHHLTNQKADQLQHKVLNIGALKAKENQRAVVHQ